MDEYLYQHHIDGQLTVKNVLRAVYFYGMLFILAPFILLYWAITRL